MSQDLRLGLAAYPSNRANEIASSTIGKPHHYQDPALAALMSARESGTTWTTRKTPPTARSAKTGEEPKRLSGGKRDLETASRTDVINLVPGSDADPTHGAPPAKKQKITYLLPNQCMDEGHFYIVLGEDIDVSTARFKMLSLLGQGTFGKVVEAWDRKYKIHCAVKIVRNVPKYTRDAGVEIRYMELVKKADPDDKYCFMKIMRYFENDQKHVCIVMPKYGPCLLDYLQKHGPLCPKSLAEMTYQAAVALDFFHTQMRMMHTDLKPENMLLEQEGSTYDAEHGTVPKSNRIRICDLGGVCDERHSKTAIVSTRHYRSPEVILGMGWMFPTDMWSMGCIIYELATGRLLYDTHENLEHLHLMEKTLGRLPAEWFRLCADEHRNTIFTSTGSLRPLTDPKSIARVARAKPIKETIKDPELLDMITSLLSYDKHKRMTAKQLAMHPYVLKHFPAAVQEPTFPGKTRSGSSNASAAR